MEIIKDTTVFKVVPTTVKVKDELPRVRKDMGEIKRLLESMERFGQIQPIVVNRNMELIAGGRRLAACILGQREALVCFNDAIEPVLMRELELEENLQRKDLTPAEECLAMEEIHLLKQSIHGKSISGKEGGWTLDQTAELVGKTRGNVIEALQIAEALKEFPSLKDLKTKSDIKRAVKGIEKLATKVLMTSQHEKELEEKKEQVIIACEDAIQHMKTIPNESVDILLTDPPYGLNIHDITIGLGGHTGADITTTGIKYDDSPEYALNLFKELAQQSYRFCTPTSHACVFLAISNFKTVREFFLAEGWVCSERPVIWIKAASGQNNNPKAWFSAAYEALLFARRPDSRLVVEGKPDWIQCDNMNPSDRVHQAEKPVPLLRELLLRTCLPSQTLYDPFCGSGSSLVAALDMKMKAIGCDNSPECYAIALDRVKGWYQINK